MFRQLDHSRLGFPFDRRRYLDPDHLDRNCRTHGDWSSAKMVLPQSNSRGDKHALACPEGRLARSSNDFQRRTQRELIACISDGGHCPFDAPAERFYGRQEVSEAESLRNFPETVCSFARFFPFLLPTLFPGVDALTAEHL